MPPPYNLILLDRDGVINRDYTPYGTLSVEQFQLLDGAAEAIALLKQAGMQVSVVTNQSAIGKELITHATLATIHTHMQQALLAHNADAIIDHIYYCADAPGKPTPYRKPGDGMLRQAMQEAGVSPQATILIGDSITDLQAAMTAGCDALLVRTGKGQQTEQTLPSTIKPMAICQDILDAVQLIVLQSGHDTST